MTLVIEPDSVEALRRVLQVVVEQTQSPHETAYLPVILVFDAREHAR